MPMMTEIVDKLLTAHQTKKPIEFIRHEYTLSEEEAYAVQEQLIEKKCEIGKDRIAGYKISMTSSETQAIAKTDEPAYGTLLQSNAVKSGERVVLSALFAPLIEPEIIFILTDDLSPGACAEEILGKSKIAAGIEIPDARYKDWFPNFSLADLICDNTATGLVVRSDFVDPPKTAEKFADIRLVLYKDGQQIDEGCSSAVLGNPLNSVVWLSKKLAEHGRRLKKGMIISSGTFLAPIPAAAGAYRAQYPGVGEVAVTISE
ncbi:2-keto-4-pentenoate hydratase [Bhargavaea ullalensis]|uniref:2-keto-4-pentenoate hydratase n=1 Tax=Bhargavaea ullalensis TaxID=1265685 RepID=A0ABV2G9T9_9BACL